MSLGSAEAVIGQRLLDPDVSEIIISDSARRHPGIPPRAVGSPAGPADDRLADSINKYVEMSVGNTPVVLSSSCPTLTSAHTEPPGPWPLLLPLLPLPLSGYSCDGVKGLPPPGVLIPGKP